MLRYILFNLSMLSHGFSQPAPAPSPSPTPSPEPTPLVFVYAYGKSVRRSFADEAVKKLNDAYLSGCIEKRFASWPVKTTENVFGIQYKNKIDAFKVFEAGRPYGVDLRWYTTDRKDSVGYTYNFHLERGKPHSEERIWSNQAKMRSTHFYASHLAHELSHQARAGGFGHYKFHQGTFPYEIGDVAFDCLSAE